MSGIRRQMIVLDMDCSVSVRPMATSARSAYKGHFGCSCYHPLFVFNQFGDQGRSSLRPGTRPQRRSAGATFWNPYIERYSETGPCARYFRADATFASPDIYEFLDAEAYTYAIRLMANAVSSAQLRRYCSPDQDAHVRPTMCDAITPVSVIRLEAGTRKRPHRPRGGTSSLANCMPPCWL